MKLGVMAAEGDVATNSGSDYLAVQKLNANPAVYNATNYLTLNHAGNTTTSLTLLYFQCQLLAKATLFYKITRELILVCLQFPTF
jgi:hypothetical protein